MFTNNNVDCEIYETQKLTEQDIICLITLRCETFLI